MVLTKLGKQLKRCQRGISALEFAIVAPVFFIAIFLSIEITFTLIADAMLDRAASRITRIGKIGLAEGQNCNQVVMQELNEGVSFWADTTRTYADVTIYTPGENFAFEDIDDEDYQPKCDTGDRGDMVVYRLGFEKPGIIGILGLFGSNLLRYERIVVIQNEP